MGLISLGCAYNIQGRARLKFTVRIFAVNVRPRVFGNVGYGLNTLQTTPVRFGTSSIPVPDISVKSVRPQYRYRTLR